MKNCCKLRMTLIQSRLPQDHSKSSLGIKVCPHSEPGEKCLTLLQAASSGCLVPREWGSPPQPSCWLGARATYTTRQTVSPAWRTPSFPSTLTTPRWPSWPRSRWRTDWSTRGLRLWWNWRQLSCAVHWYLCQMSERTLGKLSCVFMA